MKKHKRLLKLAKLIGGVEHWKAVSHPDEYVSHVVNGIEELQDDITELENENTQLRALLVRTEDGVSVGHGSAVYRKIETRYPARREILKVTVRVVADNLFPDSRPLTGCYSSRREAKKENKDESLHPAIDLDVPLLAAINKRDRDESYRQGQMEQ